MRYLSGIANNLQLSARIGQPVLMMELNSLKINTLADGLIETFVYAR